MSSKSIRGNWPTGVLKAVEKAIQALPSEGEIKESIQAIDSLVVFLQQLRKLISEQPSQEARQDVLNSITMLSGFLASHNARLLFEGKAKVVKSTVKSNEEAEHLYGELKSLSLEEIRSRLLDANLYSANDLKALAKHLHIGIDKNFRREDIADSVFKRGFANPRGYKSIGGAASQRIQDEARENDTLRNKK